MDPLSTTVSTLKGVWILVRLSKEMVGSSQEGTLFEADVRHLERQLMLLRDLRKKLRNLPDLGDGQIRDTLLVEQNAWNVFVKIDNEVFQKMQEFMKTGALRKKLNRLKLQGFWVFRAKAWIAEHRGAIYSSSQSLEWRIQCVRELLRLERGFEKDMERIILPCEPLSLEDMMRDLSA
ncbi:hypothetical protein CC79DRAFT_575772 [Sarocladium strictum]